MNTDSKQYLSMSNPTSKFNPKVSFIQIPTQFKDQVSKYTKDLVGNDEALQKLSGTDQTLSESSGCFFVIGLETIEEALTNLKHSLEIPDLPKESREYIQTAISILNGR